MSKIIPLDSGLNIGEVVPVLAHDGQQHMAKVVSARNEPTMGRPDRWDIRVRVDLGGGTFVNRHLTAPGSEPGMTVVALIDN